MSEKKRLGELGQIAFEHHATKLGFTVCRPYGDNHRYDCILDNGLRLMRMQVKTSTCLRRDNSYEVNVGHCHRYLRDGKRCLALVPYTAAEVDFIVVYIEPEDAFFIIPIAALGNRVTVFRRGNEIVLRQPAKGMARAFELLANLPEDFLPEDRKDAPPQRRKGL